MTDNHSREGLFALIEPYLASVEHPSRYIDHEFGSVSKPDAAYRVGLVYPDVYEIGQSNQAIQLLQDCVNAEEGLSAERVFLPWVDMAQIMRERGIPLFTLETFSDAGHLDMLGITLPHELCATNCLEAIDLARLPILAKDRTEGMPLVVGGGPLAYNPEPLSPFFDAFLIGEGEAQLPDICKTHLRLKGEGAAREEVLRELARRGDVYVPSLYEERGGYVVPVCEDAPEVVLKALCPSFESFPAGGHLNVPFAEITHDRYTVEVLRGCARGCRFCQAGMIYRPVRERSADDCVKAALSGLACTGFNEVSLTSLSTTDHSEIARILRRLNAALEGTDVSVSIPSQRLDAFGVEMAYLVAGAKKGGLTFAPEAGSQRLRDVINKNVGEEDLLGAVEAAARAGWRRCKLYFMCGLPTETDEDLRGIGRLCALALERMRNSVPPQERGNIRITASCALFVPKPATPFQWVGQIPKDEVERRVGVISESMPSKGVDFKWHDPDTSLVEAALARGGREMADVVMRSWESGSCFDAWTERFDVLRWEQAAKGAGVSLGDLACRSIEPGSPLPWGHISCGVSEEYLIKEYEKAASAQTTPDCTFCSCTGCGVCQALSCENKISSKRS